MRMTQAILLAAASMALSMPAAAQRGGEQEETAFMFCTIKDLDTRTIYYTGIEEVDFAINTLQRVNGRKFKEFVASSHGRPLDSLSWDCEFALTSHANSRATLETRLQRFQTVDKREGWQVAGTDFALITDRQAKP